MTIAFTSHISQLLYRAAPACNFAQVIGELRDAFTPENSTAPALTWDCDDIALLDFNTARVVIGFSDNLPGAHAACFTVATGQSPLEYAAQLESADQDLLCQSIISRLERRFPSDARDTQILEQALTADLIDRVVDDLFTKDDLPLNALPIKIVDPVQPPSDNAEPAMINTVTEPGDMDRLLQRLSTELTARTPSLISRAIASVSPRPRGAAPVDQSSAQPTAAKDEGTAAALSCGRSTASLARGLFRIKAKTAAAGGDDFLPQTGGRTPHLTSSTELKAVRDALYATDASSASVGRIVAQSKHTLQILAALPGGLANAVIDLRRGQTMRNDNKIRH